MRLLLLRLLSLFSRCLSACEFSASLSAHQLVPSSRGEPTFPCEVAHIVGFSKLFHYELWNFEISLKL